MGSFFSTVKPTPPLSSTPESIPATLKSSTGTRKLACYYEEDRAVSEAADGLEKREQLGGGKKKAKKVTFKKTAKKMGKGKASK